MHAFAPSTVYPSFLSIPGSHITLLDEFFQVVDSIVNDSPSCSSKFVELFTSNGVWKTPSGKFEAHEGHEELVNSSTTWEYFKLLKHFHHSVVEVFGIDAEGRQLMLMGRIAQETADGKRGNYPFSARVDIDDSGREPKLRSFQGWSSGF